MPPKKSAKVASKGEQTTPAGKVAGKPLGAPSPVATKAAAAQLAKQQAADAQRAVVEAAIAADEMIDRARSISVDALFTELLKRKDFVERSREKARRRFDWSTMLARLDARDATSPTWYIHVREEELVLEPDGMDGEFIEVMVIAECRQPTLAPRHGVIKQHRCWSDNEDNAPERVVHLSDRKSGLNLCWVPVLHADGRSTNAYVLQERKSTAVVGAAFATSPGASFNFGSSAPSVQTVAAPTAAGPALQPAAAVFGFGTAPAQPQPAASFGFGTPASGSFGVPAAPTELPTAAAFRFGSATSTSSGFGFSAAPSPSVADDDAAASVAARAAAVAAPQNFRKTLTANDVKLNDVQFVLWSDARVTEMAKDLTAGTRIVRPDFFVPRAAVPAHLAKEFPKTIKLIMQDDLHDKADATADDIARKFFAKYDKTMKQLDDWIDGCPIYNPKLAETMQKVRKEELKKQCDEGNAAAWQQFQPLRNLVLEELQRIIALRRREYEEDERDVAGVRALLKQGVLAPKSAFAIRKIYPKNDILRFRPFGKVPGVTESGEGVEECVPPAFQVTANWGS